MSDYDDIRFCTECKKKQPHTCSGSGNKAWCQECQQDWEPMKEYYIDPKEPPSIFCALCGERVTGDCLKDEGDNIYVCYNCQCYEEI